jgi:O-antigen/teichoic acid export membrane protein
VKRLTLRWKPGRLAKNTVWLTIGNGLRILVQAAYFILIARALGARGYGAFAGVVALAAVLAAFSGWGTGFLLIKNVARYPDRFPLYWGRALVALGVSSIALIALALVLSVWLLPAIPVSVILAVSISDLLFSPLVLICAQAFQAFQRLRQTALMLVLIAAFRLAAAWIMLLVVPAPTPEDWAGYYLAGSAIACLVCLIYVWRTLGAPRWSRNDLQSARREGLYFSVSLAAQRANNDIDKTLLVRLSTLESAGIYSAAYRLVEVVFMPVTALLAAAYARFFQHGARGIRGSLDLAYGLMVPALGYAIAGAAAIYLLAPLIPTILGADYKETVNAARWLAVLPIIGTLYAFAAHALSGAGHQGARTSIEIVAVVLNVLLNIWWIPLYSYHGAIWAMLASKTFVAMGVWYLVFKMMQIRAPSPRRFE